MSYQEKNGQVILTMSREDYNKLLWYWNVAWCVLTDATGEAREKLLEFLDRLNSGNPNYTPYQIVSDKITQPWVRREDLHSRCCDAPVMVGDDDVCSSCGRPCSHTPYKVEEKKP